MTEHQIKQNEWQGEGTVLVFSMSISKLVAGICERCPPLSTLQNLLQKSILRKMILFTRECNCCLWVRSQQAEQNTRLKDLSTREVRATKTVQNILILRAVGRLVKNSKDYIWHNLALAPNLWPSAVKKVAITKIKFIKATWRNKYKRDDPRSPCILFSTVAFQLEENTRPK